MQEKYYRTVKASERLPGKKGEKNKYIVIMSNGEIGFGFRNYSEENPEFYINLGYKSVLTNDLEWLEPIPIPDADRLRQALEKILAIKNGNIGTYLQKLIEIETIAREALSAGDGWVRVDSGVLPEANTRCWLGWENEKDVWEGYYDGHLFVDIEGFGIKNKPTHYMIHSIPSPPIK